MARARRVTRGYFLPFAMAIVFAVMAVASAMTVTTGGYRKLAATRERDLLDRMALESAVELAAEHLLAGAAPASDHQIADRDVVVEVSSPSTKVDLNADPPEVIEAALAEVGVLDRSRGTPRPVLGQGETPSPRFARFRDFVSQVGLSEAEEDCARRRLTVGRWPGALSLDVSPVSAATAPTPGEQIDVRASVRGGKAPMRVLWARLRFTGRETSVWQAHEWRFLSLSGPHACKGTAGQSAGSQGARRSDRPDS